MKKWLGIFIRNEYLCSQVNAGVHRTYSMSCTSVTRGEGRGGECSPPLILYIGKGEGKGDVLGEGLYDGIYFCLYIFSVVIIKE